MSDFVPKKSFSRRRKTCPFSGPNSPAIDWKDVEMLGRYVSERGKIMPSRITAVCASKQRVLAQAIKRARFMALMAPVRTEPEARPPRPDRGDRFDRGDRGDRGDRQDRGERFSRNNDDSAKTAAPAAE
jgi:small subunit ribosomal protein S18